MSGARLLDTAVVENLEFKLAHEVFDQDGLCSEQTCFVLATMFCVANMLLKLS